MNGHFALSLATNSTQDHLAVTGLATIVAGAQLFVFELLMQGTIVATSRRRSG